MRSFIVFLLFLALISFISAEESCSYKGSELMKKLNECRAQNKYGMKCGRESGICICKCLNN